MILPIALIFPCDFDLAYLSYSLLLYVSSISTIKKGKRDKVSIYIVTYPKIWVTTTDSTVCPRRSDPFYIVHQPHVGSSISFGIIWIVVSILA